MFCSKNDSVTSTCPNSYLNTCRLKIKQHILDYVIIILNETVEKLVYYNNLLPN